jgi:hypothetical protein
MKEESLLVEIATRHILGCLRCVVRIHPASPFLLARVRLEFPSIHQSLGVHSMDLTLLKGFLSRQAHNFP